MILMTAYGSIPQAVDAMQAGAVDYLVKPFDVNNLLSTLKKQMIKPSDDYDAPVAVDSNSIDTLKMASRVAKTEATVLLNGESGVGKEVYSRYIHQQSNRKVQPFIAINCAAIPENMLEAALFGYDKGAFTGAVKSSAGKFEQAQGGTLLLDEITEMDLALQAKILRVIQEKEVERLGSSKMIQLNVRIIATSNRDLKAEVIAKRFREDLYYRLNVFPITIPPLRERVGDIMPLVQKILEQYNRAAGQKIQISEEACERLLQHQWSGNVRELDNVIQRALILKQGNDINVSDIMIESSSLDTTSQSTMNLSNNDSGILHNDLRDRETEVIIDTLRGFKGSRKKTAEKLGIRPRTLR
jgi:two-component system response regulator FlrC